MKTTRFILYVFAAIILEMVLRVIFVSSIVVIAPEVLIFLAMIDLDSKNILTKVTISAVLYDVLNSQQFGVVSLSVLITFGVLFLFSRFSYIGGKRAKNIVFGPGILSISVFSSILFLLYFTLSYTLEDVFFNIHNSLFWFSIEIPPMSVFLYLSVIAFVVFLVLFSWRSIIKSSF